MLPRTLCENLCSLNPSLDRLTFSVEWVISPGMNKICENALDQKQTPLWKTTFKIASSQKTITALKTTFYDSNICLLWLIDILFIYRGWNSGHMVWTFSYLLSYKISLWTCSRHVGKSWQEMDWWWITTDFPTLDSQWYQQKSQHVTKVGSSTKGQTFRKRIFEIRSGMCQLLNST